MLLKLLQGHLICRTPPAIEILSPSYTIIILCIITITYNPGHNILELYFFFSAGRILFK